jgi:hypothetical protein
MPIGADWYIFSFFILKKMTCARALQKMTCALHMPLQAGWHVAVWVVFVCAVS